MTDLYLASRSDDASVLKIGRSDCAHRRCAELSRGHCFRVHVVAVWPARGLLEGAMHQALAARRVPGGGGREWFKVSEAEVYAVMGDIIRRDGEAREAHEAREAQEAAWRARCLAAGLFDEDGA